MATDEELLALARAQSDVDHSVYVVDAARRNLEATQVRMEKAEAAKSSALDAEKQAQADLDAAIAAQDEYKAVVASLTTNVQAAAGVAEASAEGLM